MKHTTAVLLFAVSMLRSDVAAAQTAPLVREEVSRALASELSGETAKRQLEEVARHHRMRGSREFRRAADFIAQELRRYGLADARVEEFPADGTRWYGTQRARPAWDAEFAELWEVRREGGTVVRVSRLASGFMVPLRQARGFQQRLARGESILLRGVVKAGQHPGAYAIVTATIPGSDPDLGEIAFSCHLDHPRPGANDNASGCVTILEVARTYAKLMAEGRLPRPLRTLRFIWPPEIEGTIAYLNERPEIASRIKATIHLDMVGGGPETKAVFHITRGPASLPSFVHDIAAALGAFVNEQSMAFAATGVAAFPLHAPEGGKEPLQAALVPFTSGSDHQVYAEGSFRIPAVYLNDWPGRYIHTNFDTPANIDPTKLLRAGFIAATTGWVLANIEPADAPAVLDTVRPQSLDRMATLARRQQGFDNPAMPEWIAPSIPPHLLECLEREGIDELDGPWGDAEAARPIQIDLVEVLTDDLLIEVEMLNRAILLSRTDTEETRRIHRICVALEHAAEEHGASPASAGEMASPARLADPPSERALEAIGVRLYFCPLHTPCGGSGRDRHALPP